MAISLGLPRGFTSRLHLDNDVIFSILPHLVSFLSHYAVITYHIRLKALQKTFLFIFLCTIYIYFAHMNFDPLGVFFCSKGIHAGPFFPSSIICHFDGTYLARPSTMWSVATSPRFLRAPIVILKPTVNLACGKHLLPNPI